MADDLTRPYIGYRSAGRRRPELNDRRASADVPVALARGALSGVLGAPGDLESLVRMLPGLSEQTVLPTSEDVERRLPLRSASETPVGRAATGLSQLAGGFYTGPGSPLRALGALPSAVRQAGRDFAMAAGQPAVNVVKPKGALAKMREILEQPMFHGGNYKRGEEITHPLYLTPSREMAGTYADPMRVPGATMQELRPEISRAAPERLVRAAARRYVPENEQMGYTPASAFDENLHDPDNIRALIAELERRNYDSAVATDIGMTQGQTAPAVVVFPGRRAFAQGGLVMDQSNLYGSDAKQDPASAYKFADGGQAGSPPAYAEGGLVANSPTVDFDPARIDAIVGELHAMNAV